jgi:hypothetical protein
MPKKKTNYESKGIVRRIAGSIFSSSRSSGDDAPSRVIANGGVKVTGGEPKWRPRKKQFERLDGDDDDDDADSRADDHYRNWTIRNVYSTESDAGEYKREILYERKRATMKHHVKSSSKKRDLSAFSIKPPTKDTMSIRPTLTDSASKKKLKASADDSPSSGRRSSGQEETFDESEDTSFNAFGFQTQDSFAPFQHDDESVSRHTISSRQTASTKHSFPNPSHHTVKLTKNNLARMAAMSASAKDTMDNGTLGRNPGKGKFYQFAIDEDKESTVVESNVGLPLGFGILEEDDEDESVRSYDDEVYTDEEEEEDDSESSAEVGSQKTKVQERKAFSVDPPKKNDFFFRDSERSHRQGVDNSEDFGAFAPKREDPIEEEAFAFPENVETSNDHLLSDDPFFEPPQEQNPPAFRQASAHSLSYSPSPTNRKKEASAKPTDRFVRDERLPLSPLGNTKASSNVRQSGLPPVRPVSKQAQKKPDPNSEWTGFQLQPNFSIKPDPEPKFDAFGLSEQPKTMSANRKNRDPSLSSTFPTFAPEFFEEGSTKENHAAARNDPRRQKLMAQQERWGSSKQAMKSHSAMAFSSDSENEGDEDDDSFGSDNLWEKSGGRVGLNKFSSGASIGESVTSYGSKRVDVDDNKSVASYGNASAMGRSNTKPLGLPSNAIMASMLFRTHYNIDQQDVEEKIKAKEEENTKYKKARSGDIPDAVHADYDYMTNVSSFSEETSHFQETWRKPSRDLLDYFSKARTMQVDTRERLERQRAKAKAALFEA